MPMYKKSMLVLLAIILTAIGVSFYGLAYDKGVSLESEPLQAQQRADASNKISVYVCGAVLNPGMVSLAADARVMDAVEACGGLLPTADTGSVNMAQSLKDGMQIKVALKKDSLQASQDRGKAGSVQADNSRKVIGSDEKININEASMEELVRLPGVGKSTAQRIIDYREANGSFQSIDDLKKIKGIGRSKFEKLESYITI